MKIRGIEIDFAQAEESMSKAIATAIEIINTLDPPDRLLAHMALCTVMNTIAKEEEYEADAGRSVEEIGL